MDKVIVITILLILIIIITVVIINIYNKLVILKNTLNKNWEELRGLISKRYELATRLINENEGSDIQKLLNLVQRHSTAVSVDDVVNCYIDLEKEIPKYHMSQELMNAFNINRESFLKTREIYNNNVLKFNGIIKSFPVNILASVTGFSKWIYFRSED